MNDLAPCLGKVCAVIGAQWGDEGKGKIVDLISGGYDVIARACGGANAGHTIVRGGKQHVFHLLPSGCFHEGKEIILGSGMVVHLPTLLGEIEEVKRAGFDILPRLHISEEAHILFDYHKILDGFFEEAIAERIGKGIGTTRRGIGPAYMDKSARIGIRMKSLGTDLMSEVKWKAESYRKQFGLEINIDQEICNLESAAAGLKGCIADTVDLIHDYVKTGRSILIEGAQGVFLDIDHGTYPHVTSSSTTVSGALQGLGLPPKVLESCIGVTKSYCTRVGGGEFPSEASAEDGDRLRLRGKEYGATTGRPRRCGWLNISDMKKAALMNGFSCWNITKLDVLDEERVIPVAFEAGTSNKIFFEELPGWNESIRGLTSFDGLPANAKNFVSFIEKQTEIPVKFIGTGPERNEMIIR